MFFYKHFFGQIEGEKLISLSVIKKLLRTSLGVGFSQVLNLVLIPVLSRLYGPQEFGPWALYYAFVSVLSVVATLRFSDAIVLVAGKKTLERLVAVCLWSGFTLAILSLAIIGIWNNLSLVPHMYLYWLPLSIMSYSIYLIGIQLLIRHEKFFSYSMVVLCVAVLPTACQILLGYLFDATADHLVMGAVVGHVMTAIVAMLLSYDIFQRISLLDPTLPSLARVYKRYPIYSGGFSVSSAIRSRAIYFFLGQSGNSTELAKYAQSDRIINSPGTVLAAVIRPVFFREISRGSIHEMTPGLMWLLRVQWTVLGPMCGWLFFNMVFLSEFVLGAKWVGVGFSAQCLIFAAFLNMTSNWLDRAYDILKIQKSNFKIEFYFGIIIVCILIMSVYGFKNIHLAFILSGISLCFFYLTWIYCLFMNLGVSFFKMVRFSLTSFSPIVIALSLMKISGIVFQAPLIPTFFIGLVVSSISALVMYRNFKNLKLTKTF